METIDKDKVWDAIVIGGGHAGLATAYYLRRTGLDFLVLDSQSSGGGAWLQAWDSLTLFSPAQSSSLPGWLMPRSEHPFPLKEEVVAYLHEYEARYAIPVRRDTQVETVRQAEDGTFVLHTNQGIFHSHAVVSATGTWSKPKFPDIPGRELFRGTQIHSAAYRNANPFAGKKVLVVGEGNSGAQILAELAHVATVRWAVRQAPRFLPDDVDGRVLFDIASAKYHAEKSGKPFDPTQYSLGNIVMVPPVLAVRGTGVLEQFGSVQALTETGVVWEDGSNEDFDAIVWCTGFGYATDHLRGLVTLDATGKSPTAGCKSTEVEGLWLMGYGGWTGYASATLIGVGRAAKQAVAELETFVRQQKNYQA